MHIHKAKSKKKVSQTQHRHIEHCDVDKFRDVVADCLGLVTSRVLESYSTEELRLLQQDLHINIEGDMFLEICKNRQVDLVKYDIFGVYFGLEKENKHILSMRLMVSSHFLATYTFSDILIILGGTFIEFDGFLVYKLSRLHSQYIHSVKLGDWDLKSEGAILLVTCNKLVKLSSRVLEDEDSLSVEVLPITVSAHTNHTHCAGTTAQTNTVNIRNLTQADRWMYGIWFIDN